MRRWIVTLCLMLAGTPLALADLAAIHEADLPQDAPILAAFQDALELEPYCRFWQPNWNYPVSKESATHRLQEDLKTVESALQAHPNSVELELLIGLLAHYAYNLDVPNSQDKILHALNQAHTLAPQDLRASWFHASFLCQTTRSAEGAGELLKIENEFPSDQLPAAFWSDYFECANTTNMPAHATRAASLLGNLHSPDLARWQEVVDADKKRFQPFNPGKHYDPHEVWSAVQKGDDTIFTSTTCGAQIAARNDWRVNQVELSNGSCIANFSTGPYEATTQTLRPSVLLLVQQPQPGETLHDYLGKFLKHGTFTSFIPSRCPAQECLAMLGLQPGMYGADGDGHGRILAFEREDPVIPGLLFESPQSVQTQGSAQGPQTFRPGPIPQRISGKLFYLVLLDTAASIDVRALDDFNFFLSRLQVE